MTNGFEPQTFGKYVLTERIGAGGMAEIFRATAYGVEGFTKDVCIKRILPTLTSDETFVKMFIDEAKIAVALHHPNVVQVFDLGRIGEHYFIAMELVRGRDLLQLINRCRAQKTRLPVHLALYLISEVCKGLDYAHKVRAEGRPLGIIHRDVSPSNILISWDGIVKVADFGIAKAVLKDEKTVTGTMKGKYGYMSPEQVKGEHTDHRSDIFAAGVLMWEALACKRLFKGETDLETLERVRVADVPKAPSAHHREVSPEVDRLVLKALAADPRARYQTAGEFHAAIADQLFAMGKRVDAEDLSRHLGVLFEADIRDEEARIQAQRVRLASLPQPVSQPPLAAGPTPTPSPLPPGMSSPPTRPDLPSYRSAPPGRRGLSPLVLGLLGVATILAVGAGVVLAVWFAYEPAPRPQPGPPPDAGPAPIAAPRLGSLMLESRPGGADIELDGLPTGQRTPAVLRGLERTRAHQLRLRLEGHQPWDKLVEFGEAESVAVSAELQAVPKPEPPPKRPPVRPPPPEAPAMGTLNVNVSPGWAYVYVDGVKQERPTPLLGLRLKAGPHTIRLVNPKQGKEAVRKVTLAKDKTEDLLVELR
ncbi:MAG TPA: serine/threonine-protein kinase [Myxococcota bacterium]|nr:serine/threonine-protein kinase [Myxococcota bacterium]HRY95703.1 serine/threonine-protein kinase [Myxococcota bacterium]HSA21802.1 serine/threonine-protein kinase [Myxococcota bacterium]